jgi:hypothetical protein
MPEITLTTLWDRHTPRPHWAGQGTIEYKCVRPAMAYSDVKRQNADDQMRRADVPGIPPAGPCPPDPEGYLRVPRPTMITSAVIPVSTTGHRMEDVAGRDLAYTGLHRGHVFAVSLGGSDDSANMVPQVGINNTTQVGFTDSSMETLKWREMEVFVAGLATLGWEQRLLRSEVPRSDDLVTYTPRGGGQASIYLKHRGDFFPYVGPFDVTYPKIEDYQQDRLGDPSFIVSLTYGITYSKDDRDNWPQSMTVQVDIDDNVLFVRDFHWDTRPGDQMQVDWALGSRKRRAKIQRANERRVSLYRSLHPRRYPPMSGFPDPDEMEIDPPS